MEVNLNKIKGLMREHGETQAELAEYLGCSTSAVQSYLAGKTEMPSTVFIRIAKKYEVPIGELTTEEQ